jgi:hypothetical protein
MLFYGTSKKSCKCTKYLVTTYSPLSVVFWERFVLYSDVHYVYVNIPKLNKLFF